MNSLDQLAIHTITLKAWDLPTVSKKFAEAGVTGMGLWRNWLDGRRLKESRRIIDDHGIKVASLVRGGFFPHLDAAQKQNSLQDNLKAIDEAVEMGAPQIVLVCGAIPELSLDESRKHIEEGIAELAEHARKAKVTLAIEPLHPMYADCRSAVNTIGQCNDIIDAVGDDHVGIAADVFHIWWDPSLKAEIKRAGKRIVGFHVCDWKTPTEDMLNDRGLMGEGCIQIKEIRQSIEEHCDFKDWIEVEIFSDRYWAQDPDQYLTDIIEAYKAHV